MNALLRPTFRSGLGPTWTPGLGPRSRLLLSVAFAVTILRVETAWGLAVFAALAALGAWEGRVPPRRLVSLVLPVLPLVALAGLYALLSGSGVPGLQATATPPLTRAAVAAGRLLLLVAGAGIASLAASPPALLDALSRLLKPLRRCGLPVREVAWTALLALRFLPLLRDEAATVALARRARGAALGAATLGGQVRSLLALAVPVTARTLRRADDLGLAMEARGFRLDRDPVPHRDPWTLAEAVALLLTVGLMAWTAFRY